MTEHPLLRSALLLLGSASLASAATNLINLDLNTGSNFTYSGAGALGLAGDLWTTAIPTSAGLASTSLNFSDGTASGITVVLDPAGAATTNMNGMFAVTTGGNLLRDFAGLHTSSAAFCNINLSGFAANQSLATIILYGMNGDGSDGANPNQNASFTVGATTKSTNAPTPTSTLTENVNYVRFDNVQADGSGNLVITWANPAGGSAWSSFNGLQIQTVPEPSAALLGGLGLFALLRRRR